MKKFPMGTVENNKPVGTAGQPANADNPRMKAIKRRLSNKKNSDSGKTN